VLRAGGETSEGFMMFEVVNTAEFEEQGDNTVIHVTSDVVGVYDAAVGEMAMKGMETGWKQTLDRLEAEIARAVKLGARS
jgi:hypothetical protein